MPVSALLLVSAAWLPSAKTPATARARAPVVRLQAPQTGGTEVVPPEWKGPAIRREDEEKRDAAVQVQAAYGTADFEELGGGSLVRYGGSESWWDNLRTTFRSRVLLRIMGHLLSTVAFASLVSLAFGAARSGRVPVWLARVIQSFALPGLPHSAVGGIVGLLLAFRTNQAYQRFWEARTLWDGVYAKTRGLVRLAAATDYSNPMPGKAPGKGAELIVGLAASYPYALKQHLRGERDLNELVDAATTASSCTGSSTAVRQLADASVQPNVPLAILDKLTRAVMLQRKRHGDLIWWQLDEHIVGLVGILSKVERLKGTPVPLSYSRHTSRFFSVYTFTLPFALVHGLSLWLMPVTVAVIAWVIYATEEIGHIIDEPFGTSSSSSGNSVTEESDGSDEAQLEVLPLGRYCADIASDAATIYFSKPITADVMPDGDLTDDEEDVELFDEVG